VTYYTQQLIRGLSADEKPTDGGLLVGTMFTETDTGDRYKWNGSSWEGIDAGGAHNLGGASHNADTLANLNTKVSDATLDDSSAARTPASHGNEAHSATFIQAGDVTYENLNANSDVGTGATQVAQGNHTHAGGSEAFPIGSVFLSVVSTNPNTLLGYGTWSQIAAGQFLVGQNGADADFDVAEETGGAKTHTHAEHATYSHGQNTDAPKWWDTAGGDSKPDAHPAQSHDTPSNLPPYFVIYCWKRTA